MSENTERDELANLIFEQDMCQHKGDARDVADAILAAGYRKPRTITTVEELDALPAGSAAAARAELPPRLDQRFITNHSLPQDRSHIRWADEHDERL